MVEIYFDSLDSVVGARVRRRRERRRDQPGGCRRDARGVEGRGYERGVRRPRGPLEPLPRGEGVHHRRGRDAVPGHVLGDLLLPKGAGRGVGVAARSAAVGAPARDLATLAVVVSRKRGDDDRRSAASRTRGATVRPNEASPHRVISRRREHTQGRARVIRLRDAPDRDDARRQAPGHPHGRSERRGRSRG